MSSPWVKRGLWVAAGGVALAGLVLAFRPQPVPVETAPVVKGPFEQWIEEDGQTRVRERYVVSAPIAGKVRRIAFKAGDRVEQGALLAVMEPGIPGFVDARATQELEQRLGAAEAALAQANAGVERARVALEQAEADAARTRKLAGEGFVAPSAREQAELQAKLKDRELAAARFERHAAGHQVEMARAALARVRRLGAGGPQGDDHWEIRSPVSASVLKVVQESEAVVPVGAPLLELGDCADVEVVVDVLTEDAVGIRPGARATLDLGAARPLQGTVRRVEPGAFTKVSALGVEEQRVNVLIDINSPWDQEQCLGDAYRARTRIVLREQAEGVKIPTGALFRVGEQWGVFVDEGGRARRRVVQVAGRNPFEALIAGGLAPGERVIVYPGDALEDGRRVVERGGADGR